MSDGRPDDVESDADPTEEAAPAEPGPNVFADNRRRRIPGVLYVLFGAGSIAAWGVRAGHDPVMLNAGMALAGVLLVAFGMYSFATGRRLEVDEEAALLIAATAVQRPMGHASAQIGWRGWSSRPTWRILWYSAEDPPRHRGLVLVDGIDGEVLDLLVEPNPESGSSIDWRLGDQGA